MNDPRHAARRFGSVDELIAHLQVLAETDSVEAPDLRELDHGLQTAALLRSAAPDDIELQIAGLVHDLAHPWDTAGQPHHAAMGANAVVDILGERIAELIRGHVPAKRYLVATRADYAELLSADSTMTLTAQGGPMNAVEIAEFEQHPDWESMVLLRVADDAAKVPGAAVDGLEVWLDALHALASAPRGVPANEHDTAARPVFAPGDQRAVEFFERHGWVLTAELGDDEVADLGRWVDEVAAWPDTDGEWLHHRELTDHGPRLCRSENFIPYHDELRHLLTARLIATASLLLGEPAVLYKEKINYKLAGGAGYSPHQDAPAYPFIDSHISCMIAVDPATAENGCLEVVSGAHAHLLPMDERGCIAPDVVVDLDWETVELPAGQTLWFHSRTPHRSGANHSPNDRRAIYPTYNAAREGNLRNDYYREKRARLHDQATTGTGRVVVSLIGDFEGRPID